MDISKKQNASNSNVVLLAKIGIMAAVICVLGPLSVPIGPIPVSLTPFAVFLTAYLLGKKDGTIAYFIYMLIGLVGVPVFSGFTGGPQKLFGPTGGYLLSFTIMAFITGFFIEKFQKPVIHFLGCLLALAISYTIGTLWLAVQAHMSIGAAVAAAVLPFIGFDIIKIIAALIAGKAIKAALIRAGLFA